MSINRHWTKNIAIKSMKEIIKRSNMKKKKLLLEKKP
jgi:hypothetical protein